MRKKVFWIDPLLLNTFAPPPNWWWFARIDKRLKNKLLKRYLFKIAMGKTYYNGDWDKKIINFQNSDWYKKIEDLKNNFDDYKNSNWYKSIYGDIENKGFYKHKDKILNNKYDIERFFENNIYFLINSLKEKGFRTNESNKDDIPKVLIGRNGQIIKSGNGCHRLAIIKIYKIKCKYPIKIVAIHKKLKNDKKFKNIEAIDEYISQYNTSI